MGSREQQIKQLVLSRVGKCGQCGSAYGLSDVSVLGSKEDLWFLMLVCAHCRQAVGVAAVVKEQSAVPGEQAGGAESKLVALGGENPPEATDPVSAGDVADMREFLQGFDGDFKRLFEGRV